MSACVLLHGFTGSPHEIEPLAVHLRSLGYDVYTPVLAGHAATRADMRKATWQQWVESAELVVKLIIQTHPSVHIIGFSMGGLIAAHLAVSYPVRSLTVLAAPVYYLNKQQMLRTIQLRIRDNLFKWQTRATPDKQVGAGLRDTLLRYRSKIRITPLNSVLQFRRLVAELIPSLPQVTVPTLIMQGVQDDLVQPRSARYIYETISSTHKYVYLMQDSGHMLCLGSEQHEINRLAADFISSVDSEVQA